MYSRGLLHMDEQRHDNQLEPTYSSSVPVRNVALKTCRKRDDDDMINLNEGCWLNYNGKKGSQRTENTKFIFMSFHF